MNFPISDFSPPGGLSPVHIHFKGNQKVDTEVDIQKGEVPTISKGRSTGMVLKNGGVLFHKKQMGPKSDSRLVFVGGSGGMILILVQSYSDLHGCRHRFTGPCGEQVR